MTEPLWCEIRQQYCRCVTQCDPFEGDDYKDYAGFDVLPAEAFCSSVFWTAVALGLGLWLI